MSHAVIIGGGHNGLVCSCYLAAAGLDVTVLERRHLVGGAAVTEEFYPGFRNSTASYTVSLLHPKIMDDLHLTDHGLKIVNRPVSNFLLQTGGDGLLLYPDVERTCRELDRFSSNDARRLPEYYRMMDGVVGVMRELLLATPPPMDNFNLSRIFEVIKTGRQFKGLPLIDKQLLLQLFAKSAGDMLDEHFDSDPIKAVLGFDAIVGNFASPYTPGSAYVLLHHVIGETNGIQGAWGHAMGGMGAITQSMAREAERCGVKIRTDTRVSSVLIENGKARGAITGNGEEIRADIVVANVDPRTLFLDLVGSAHLDAEVHHHFQQYQCASGSLRINLALGELPQFSGDQGSRDDRYLSGGIIIGPSLDYMDKAYHSARAQGFSQEPVIEMLIPSTLDDSLAPPGKHVASLFCQHFDPALGDKWDEQREVVGDLIIDQVNQYAPNFRNSILGRKVLTPWDLERDFSLPGGDISHGRLTLDQLYIARPMLGLGRYRSPVNALYMCGAGTHPGGGVSGIPGHNAAREILRDFKSGSRRWMYH